MNRAIGIRLQYADGKMRALVVQALYEKAEGDRKAASDIAASFENTVHEERLMAELHANAELAEQIADELEGADISDELREAVEGIAPAVKKLRTAGCEYFEQVTDPCGIVVERWVAPNGESVILYGTPHWRNIFVSVAPNTRKWDKTYDDAFDAWVRS